MAERQKQQPVPSGATFAPNRLVLLVTIVQKGKGTFFADFLQTFDANLQISVVGTGTAQSDLVEFLGLKALIQGDHHADARWHRKPSQAPMEAVFAQDGDSLPL